MLSVAETVRLEESESISAVEQRATRAAQQAGVAAASVERLPFDLSELDRDGILVNVDARNFGLLDRRLDWQSLGVTLPRGTGHAFRPPRCGLVPDRYRLPIVRPAAQAHTALHRFGYRFRLVETILQSPEYRWIPWRAWPAFEQAFERASADLGEAQARYAADYTVLRPAVVETFRQLAADSSRRLAATGTPVSDAFEDAVVRGVLASLPTPDLLRSRLSLRYRVGVLHLGSELLAEQRRGTEARQALEDLASQRRLAGERERLVQDELFAARERVRRQLRAEEDEQQREAEVKQRLRELKLAAARERLQDTLSPIEEGARQLHAAVFDAAATLRASLKKRGALHGSSARKARELARWFRLMSWQGDGELESLLGELETLASAPPARRKAAAGSLEQVLADIVSCTYTDARALAEPNRMAELEL